MARKRAQAICGMRCFARSLTAAQLRRVHRYDADRCARRRSRAHIARDARSTRGGNHGGVSGEEARAGGRTDPYYTGFTLRLPDYWRLKEWEREFDELCCQK